MLFICQAHGFAIDSVLLATEAEKMGGLANHISANQSQDAPGSQVECT
jgi:hypothetical protein